ncbi:MAG TPA: GAF domain-containing protein, partial [Spirochaetota bacterium]|nr:GAF domain-containing protein [Spirochaetota bacterium]
MNKYLKLIEIMNKINSEMNFQDLISMIIDSAKELIGVEGASLLLIDRETSELIFDIVISEKGEIIRDRRLKIGEGLAGHVAATGERVLIRDVDGDDRFCQDIDRSSGFKTRDLIAVPVMVKNVRIGVLEAVNSMSPEGFIQNDLMMLQYLADAAAVAINNRELVVNLKNRVDELTCIYEIAQSIYFTLDVEVFLGKILHAVNRVIRAGRCSFVILDETRTGVKYFVSTQGKSHPVDLDNSLMGHVIRTGDPMLVYNIDDDSRYKTSLHRVGDYRSKSFLCVPMKLREKVIGVLNVTDKPRGDIFDSFDLRVLSTVANQVAETYENVMLQKRDIEREIMDKDLAIAAEIQKMALSGIPSGIQGADIGAFTMAAHSVGGDFYEVSTLEGGRFSIAVADV